MRCIGDTLYQHTLSIHPTITLSNAPSNALFNALIVANDLTHDYHDMTTTTSRDSHHGAQSLGRGIVHPTRGPTDAAGHVRVSHRGLSLWLQVLLLLLLLLLSILPLVYPSRTPIKTSYQLTPINSSISPSQSLSSPI